MRKMKTEAEKRAKKKYEAKCKRLLLTFYPTEVDLLQKLEEERQKSPQRAYSGYIKDLIRKDIKDELPKLH